MEGSGNARQTYPLRGSGTSERADLHNSRHLRHFRRNPRDRAMAATLHGQPEPAKITPTQSNLQETAYAAVIAAVVVAAVYLGRPLLVPLALSILMAFALAPVVEYLRKLRLGRVPGVILTVTLAVFL